MEELADISMINEIPELTGLLVDEYEDEILAPPDSATLRDFEYVSCIFLSPASVSNSCRHCSFIWATEQHELQPDSPRVRLTAVTTVNFLL